MKAIFLPFTRNASGSADVKYVLIALGIADLIASVVQLTAHA